MNSEGPKSDRRYRRFLQVAWVFIAYNLFGMVVGSLLALPASNGSQGDVHNVWYQALAGDGTALSPPFFLLAIVILAGIAATRGGWIRRIGAFGVWFFAGFYLSAGELGEITSTTSPLTGMKWDLVLILGSIGIAIAAAVLVAGLWMLVGALRSRTVRSSDSEGPANAVPPGPPPAPTSVPK